MVTKRLLIFILFVFSFSFAHSKDTAINAKGKRLNLLLNELAERYDLLISFDDASMASVKLPQGRTFNDIGSLFKYLQQQHYIKVDTIGNSFVLRRLRKKNYTYHGKVVDAKSGEALPNAEVICNDFHTYTNRHGYFTFLAPENETKPLQIRHLGYAVLDTFIKSKKLIRIPMQSRTANIENVVVKSGTRLHNVNIGNRSGALKLTPEFVSKLPGYGESSMYSFLKLMPGVLATGESANDMSLRGSSEGQNVYMFDNYKVYSPWYKLSEIGTINPLMVKDLEVYKSGVDASVGEHVGGVVMLKGMEAIPQCVKGQAFVNNFVANTMVEIPLGKKVALVLAARKNIKKQLELPDAIGNYVIRNIVEGFATNYQVNVNPVFDLYDGNVKLLYKIGQNSNFSVSGFGSLEKDKLDNVTLTDVFKLRNKQERRCQQYAGALNYNVYEQSGKQLELTVSYSSIKSKVEGVASLLRLDKDKPELRDVKNEESGFLQEFRLQAKRRIPFLKGGFWEYGLGLTNKNTKDTWQKERGKWLHKKWHQLAYGFLNANFSISSKWRVALGSRLNYFHAVGKPLLEPRFSLSYYANENWKIYGAYGAFQQFVYQAHIFDKLKNIKYRRISADKDIPVLKLNDLCFGTRYANPIWTLSAELFFKYTDERVRASRQNIEEESDKGGTLKLTTEKLRYLGGDLFVKYQNRGFISWLSLTLSDFSINNPAKEEEKANDPVYSAGFSRQFYFDVGSEAYESSNYDMRQELKWAAAYTWRKLTLSSSYVYGSGFKLWHAPHSQGVPDYSRFDLGASYQFNFSQFSAEVGCSLLNLLNRKNKKLDEFSRFGVGNDIVSYNTYGLRFTTAFFAKISF